MCSKRPYIDDSSTQASLINVMNGEMFPIKDGTECIIGSSLDSTIIIEELFISRRHCSIRYENNRFVDSDLQSTSGTFLNSVRLPVDINHATELQQRDLIGFGRRRNIIISYKFILHTIPSKKLKLNNEQCVVEVYNADKKYKNTLSKLQAKILNLKDDLKILRDKAKTELAKLQNTVDNIMDITSMKTFKAKNIIQQMNNQVSTLKLQLTEATKEQSASEEIKKQFYVQLENEFQCSICRDLVCNPITLNCSHSLCTICIITWMYRNNYNCPFCRASIQTVSKCLVLENYITKICNFRSGEIKE